jgi:endonuclease/exonuclease/phosphatase family metal-dependent hydrolase
VAAGNGWEQRKEFCAEVIARQQADIICIQEGIHAQWTDLCARLPEYESYGLSNRRENYDPLNAIFFSKRYEIITSSGFWLSETPHVAGSASWDSSRPRFANWVQLIDPDSGREFRVWNSHLDHIGPIARVKGAEVIVQGSEVFTDLPQLLTGDFNTDASDSAIGALKAGGWIDTFEAFLGPRFLGERPSARIVGKMDFIFARGPVKMKAAEIIRDERNGRFPSDHYFISAEVIL